MKWYDILDMEEREEDCLYVDRYWNWGSLYSSTFAYIWESHNPKFKKKNQFPTLLLITWVWSFI